MSDDLEQRLRRLGEVPLDAESATAHRLAIAEVARGANAPRKRFGWKAVAAAAIGGFLAGSTGLAAAGTLPDPAQDVAHDVLGAVGINVPRSTEGCPEGTTYRNHGEYVSAVEAAGGDVEAAAHSDCGMPLRGGGNGNGNGNGGTPGTPRPDTDGDPCTGPPPWAGAHLDRVQREALQAERQALCGTDETEEPEDEDVDIDEEEAPAVTEEPTTTISELGTTTTTVDETTSTTEG
jgi:hypothetical protein